VRLLLVEDTERLARSLAQGLREEGIDVRSAATGAASLRELAAEPPDIAILDLGLPDLDGMEVLSRAREAGFRQPILVLTARDAVESRVEALDRGADDYVIKPVAFEELYARVRALVRRSNALPAPQLSCGDLTLEPGESGAAIAGRRVRLSPTERALLECLLRRRERDVKRRDILLEVFGYDFDPGTNAIDVHVSHLRRKLAGATASIVTVRGVGYRLTAGGAG
jgi:DNA-binding response OmpR family regulator